MFLDSRTGAAVFTVELTGRFPSSLRSRSYVSSWQSLMKTHEVLGDSRIRFAQKLSEISEELVNLAKEVDKNRKYARDTGNRLERNLLEAESSVEKSRTRFDSAAEDLERLLLLKSGESTKGGELQGTTSSAGPPGKRTLGKAIGKGGLLFKNKNPQQVSRSVLATCKERQADHTLRPRTDLKTRGRHPNSDVEC